MTATKKAPPAKTDTKPKPRPKRRRRRGKKKGRHYFTQEHEDAIVRYCITTSQRERSELYEKLIGPAFDEMVDKIVFTYKFTNLPNCDDLRAECKVWLTTILDKYDPNKGSKAFSYFSVITKNWFIHKVKKTNQQLRTEVNIDDIVRYEQNMHDKLITSHQYYNERKEREFWEHLWGEIDSWDTGNLKENEKKVLEAVKILLSNTDDIEIFNKKAIYLYLREITGLNTKQVVNNLNKLRAKYKTFKTKWNKGDI
jgi:DNA-directed RNA polymerase specialized sigma subunit